jgi:transposase
VATGSGREKSAISGVGIPSWPPVREPERFDELESQPAEEYQVDFGMGALTLAANGKYRRPYLFVMSLKYSGKAFRKVVWKADQQSWARLHEEAFHALGGVCAYVVLDNLKQGVIRPDLYEPQLNPVYAAMLAHYGAVADVCRVGDPHPLTGGYECRLRQSRHLRLPTD